MRAFVLLLAGAALCASGCKKSPSYDRSSPEATLKSFFSALDKGRIPEDLGVFLADDTELSAWKLRCRSRGCTTGKLAIVEKADSSGYTATLVADYTVYSRDGVRVMRGKRSPIRLQRDGEVWRITQFGRRVTVSSGARDGGVGDASAGDAAAADDASPPDDAADEP